MSDARRERQDLVAEAAGDPRVGALLTRIRRGWAPPPILTVSEFADRELVVTSGPLAGTRWRTDFAPYQRGILDAFHSQPGLEYLAVQGSAQFGKTSCALALAAYHMAHDPCQILVVEPTGAMADDFSKSRLDTLISVSPILTEKVSKKRAKDSSNTILSKRFLGGEINIACAGSEPSLAARSVRLLILDETGKYALETKSGGSTIRQAMKRTASYRGRRRIVLLSTPTVEGDTIGTWFKRGDQRRYYVPCPECGLMHTYQWANVKWEKSVDGKPVTDKYLDENPSVRADHDPTTARLHCPACDYAIDDAQRVAVLSKGEWRADHPEKSSRVASFHIWEAYSPFSSLTEIVTAFLAARASQKAGDKSEMHTWINETLGEQVLSESGEVLEPEALLSRVEVFAAPAPKGVCFVTCGADTQDDRLEALVIGWGPGEESWLLDRQRIPGDPTNPGPWLELDNVLARTYAREGGGALRIAATCLDTAGHRTTQAYDYVAKHVKLARHRVYGVIGRGNTPEHSRPIVSKPSPQTWGKGGRPIDLYTIGVDAAKPIIVDRLNLTEPGPGYVHLPTDPAGASVPRYEWVDFDLVEQLTAERLVPKYSRGVTVHVWRKVRSGARNEMLDCSVYALAALRLCRVDLTMLSDRMLSMGAATQQKQPPRERRVARSDYLR